MKTDKNRFISTVSVMIKVAAGKRTEKVGKRIGVVEGVVIMATEKLM